MSLVGSITKTAEEKKWRLVNSGDRDTTTTNMSSSFQGEILSHGQQMKEKEISSGTSVKSRGFYVILAKESPSRLESDSDEYFSDADFHQRETDFCRDSSDSYSVTFDESKSDLEYDVASCTATEDAYSNASSSGTDEALCMMTIATSALCQTSTDFADTEEDNTDNSTDSEFTVADFWICINCKNPQNNPMFRYCEKCYQIRRTHFPPPPRTKKKRSNRIESGASWSISKSTVATASALSSVFGNGNISNKLSCLGTGREFLEKTNPRKRKLKYIERKNYGKKSKKLESSSLYSPINSMGSSSSSSEDEHNLPDSQKDSGFGSAPSSQDFGSDEVLSKNDDEGNSSDTIAGELDESELAELSKDYENNDSTTATSSNTTSSLDRHSSEIPPASNVEPKLLRSVSCIDSSTTTSTATTSKSVEDINFTAIPSYFFDKNANESATSCMICLNEPKNGVFVHSAFLHSFCCYKCAVKIWQKSKKCPICNCPVKNVMKLFVH